MDGVSNLRLQRYARHLLHAIVGLECILGASSDAGGVLVRQRSSIKSAMTLVSAVAKIINRRTMKQKFLDALDKWKYRLSLLSRNPRMKPSQSSKSTQSADAAAQKAVSAHATLLSIVQALQPAVKQVREEWPRIPVPSGV